MTSKKTYLSVTVAALSLTLSCLAVTVALASIGESNGAACLSLA
jgi:hypothetical protein